MNNPNPTLPRTSVARYHVRLVGRSGAVYSIAGGRWRTNLATARLLEDIGGRTPLDVLASIPNGDSLRVPAGPLTLLVRREDWNV